MAVRNIPIDELKVDFIGINSLNWSPDRARSTGSDEVRLRVAARTKDKISASRIGEKVETLYTNGPAGGSGASKSVSEILSVASMLINANDVTPTVCIMEVQ